MPRCVKRPAKVAPDCLASIVTRASSIFSNSSASASVGMPLASSWFIFTLRIMTKESSNTGAIDASPRSTLMDTGLPFKETT